MAAPRTVHLPVRNSGHIHGYPHTNASHHVHPTLFRPSATSSNIDYSGSKGTNPISAKRIGAPYVRTRYLLISWAGERGFAKDLQPLKALFDKFGFEGESYEIPKDEPDETASVEDRLKAFKSENPKDNELHIVVYGGHGISQSHHKRDKLLWTRTDAFDNYVQWNRIQDEVLFNDDRDTFLILDCCHAGAAHRAVSLARADILAACDSKHRTLLGFKNGNSFTALVAQAMTALAKVDGTFTPSRIFQMLCVRRSSPKPFYEGRPEALEREIVFCYPPSGRGRGGGGKRHSNDDDEFEEEEDEEDEDEEDNNEEEEEEEAELDDTEDEEGSEGSDEDKDQDNGSKYRPTAQTGAGRAQHTATATTAKGNPLPATGGKLQMSSRAAAPRSSMGRQVVTASTTVALREAARTRSRSPTRRLPYGSSASRFGGSQSTRVNSDSKQRDDMLRAVQQVMEQRECSQEEAVRIVRAMYEAQQRQMVR